MLLQPHVAACTDCVLPLFLLRCCFCCCISALRTTQLLSHPGVGDAFLFLAQRYSRLNAHFPFSAKWSDSLPLSRRLLCVHIVMSTGIYLTRIICQHLSLPNQSVLHETCRYITVAHNVGQFLFLIQSFLSAACDEQRQALFRVLRVWHHYWWQAQAVAYRGESLNGGGVIACVHSYKLTWQFVKN